ncbi:MAG TPA: hypothetical protein ENG92_00960 [Thiolapillus brandeum]|uniref:DUF7931 domain-containing protein n=1 Tax=Thiolapillus brandeum TaxID=1076588 RepID=A0A831KB00_9GAMM|nr:hypothetical protein [Thiolapillus brandeum]
MTTVDVEKFVLGETAKTVNVSSFGDLKLHSCHMAASCQRKLRIFSHRLNPEIYNQPCFIEAVRQLAIRYANTRIQLLVADTVELARGGHRLVQLTQAMPSSLEIRKRADEFRAEQRSFLLADDCGYILRDLWSDPANVQLDYNAPYKVRNLGDDFLHMWDRSEPDPALRRLAI